MPAGRPTKYTTETLDSARNYFSAGFEELGEPVPTIAGLAEWLDITRRTVYDWAAQEEKAEFSHIVEKIMAKQERMLMAGGLNGGLNPTITKLALSKHGYHDKHEQEISGPNKGPIETKWQIEVVHTDAKAPDPK